MELYAYVLTTETLPTEAEALSRFVDALPFGDAEAARLRAVSHPTAFRQSLGGKLALWRLAEERRLPPPLTILRDESGKPRFADPAHPAFSLSHSEPLSLAVLTDRAGVDVGADLQFVTPRPDLSRLAARCLTEEERAEWAQRADPTTDFFRLWSQKEAAAKQSGRGLTAILAGEASAAPLCSTTLRLRYGDRIAYLSIAASRAITGVHLIHSIKELSYEQLSH